MALTPCLGSFGAACPIVPACQLKHALEEAREAFLRVLDGYTIADLVASGPRMQRLLGIAAVINVDRIAGRKRTVFA
jgi:Rrf2 family nitric oxide-sensitive transcriptional repressor